MPMPWHAERRARHRTAGSAPRAARGEFRARLPREEPALAKEWSPAPPNAAPPRRRCPRALAGAARECSCATGSARHLPAQVCARLTIPCSNPHTSTPIQSPLPPSARLAGPCRSTRDVPGARRLVGLPTLMLPIACGKHSDGPRPCDEDVPHRLFALTDLSLLGRKLKRRLDEVARRSVLRRGCMGWDPSRHQLVSWASTTLCPSHVGCLHGHLTGAPSTPSDGSSSEPDDSDYVRVLSVGLDSGATLRNVSTSRDGLPDIPTPRPRASKPWGSRSAIPRPPWSLCTLSAVEEPLLQPLPL